MRLGPGPVASVILAMGLLPACPRAGGPVRGALGSVSLTLVHDGASGPMREVHLRVLKVGLRNRDGAWVELPVTDPGQGQPLLCPQGGSPRPLVDQAQVPAGEYMAARILVGPGHSCTLRRDGSTHALTVPVRGNEFGLPALKVGPGAPADWWLRLDCTESVREAPPGSGSYEFRASLVKVQDRASTGTISGRIADAVSRRPLAGVTVRAQSGAGELQLYRTVITRDDGSYTLDLLPLAQSIRVVTLPEEDGDPAVPAVHGAASSGNVALTADRPHQDHVDLACPPLPARAGAVSGACTWPEAPALASKEVYLVLESCPSIGAEPAINQVVRHERLSPQGTFRFGGLPPGRYRVVILATWGGPGPDGGPAPHRKEAWVQVGSGLEAKVQPR